MLTRLQVKGFKNLFDAIELLSRLADETLTTASRQIRSPGGRGDPRDLFWDGYGGAPKRLELAAEMIVSRVVEDDLGAEKDVKATFLRYELALGVDPPEGRGSIGRLVLLKEELTHITKGGAAAHLSFKHSARKFRDEVITGDRRGGAFLSTEHTENGTVINVHGDGGSRGRPQPRAAGHGGRTVLSTMSTNDYPTILAARREMQGWQRLALEPSALREPDEFTAERPSLDQTGRYLAATLFRVAQSPDAHGRIDPDAVYARVAGRLSDLTGVRVEALDVQLDEGRELFTLFLTERGGLRLPARELSEGTLRFLALCVLLEDPQSTGLVCMEEPENGIHPENLAAMVELVRDLAVDPASAPGDDNPFRQVIINTHPPGVVQMSGEENLLLAETATVRTEDGRKARALALAPYRGTWRAKTDRTFSVADVVPYLTVPAGSQMKIPLDLAG